MRFLNRFGAAPLIIYHADCADGFTAAWCFYRKYGDRAIYVEGHYQHSPPDVEGCDVYLVDFSYKRDVVEKLLLDAASVTLIDHHKSALDDLKDLPGLKYHIDINRSGATLAWSYLFPDEKYPLLLEHVEDRDLWRFKLQNTKEVMACLFTYNHDFDVWNELMSADESRISEMVNIGKVLISKHDKDTRELVKLCKRRMVIAGYDVPVASIPYMFASEAGHIMAEGERFAACYIDTDSERIFSLRSNNDGVDLSEIAKHYGGGGHVRAAGFKVPRGHALARS
jgi:uncharacterized protein